jgi:predicted acylesterase/phospholipase RssA
MRCALAFFLLLPFLAFAQERPTPTARLDPTSAEITGVPQVHSLNQDLGSTTDQQGPPEGRLKIGVALEGGGALGLAHIGVLQ